MAPPAMARSLEKSAGVFEQRGLAVFIPIIHPSATRKYNHQHRIIKRIGLLRTMIHNPLFFFGLAAGYPDCPGHAVTSCLDETFLRKERERERAR